jgi:Domain of unknown function (DUF4399)
MLRRITLAALGMVCLTLAGCATVSPPSQRVYFVEPADGATVSSPVKVKFGVVGMDLKPAGDEAPNSGHHHVLVNLDSMPAGTAIPFSDQHVHFGKAQTEGELKLPPGKYKLTLQFADKDHTSYGAPMSSTISITVR